MRFVTARFTSGVWTTGNYERMIDPVFFHLIGNSFILSVIGGIAAVVGTPATLTLMGLLLVAVGLAIVYYS